MRMLNKMYNVLVPKYHIFSTYIVFHSTELLGKNEIKLSKQFETTQNCDIKYSPLQRVNMLIFMLIQRTKRQINVSFIYFAKSIKLTYIHNIRLINM